MEPRKRSAALAPKDPRDALEATAGRYRDAAQALSMTAKLDFLPRAPDPTPFELTGRASGDRA